MSAQLLRRWCEFLLQGPLNHEHADVGGGAKPPSQWLRSSSTLEAAEVLAEMHRPVLYQGSSADSAPGISWGHGVSTRPTSSSQLLMRCY